MEDRTEDRIKQWVAGLVDKLLDAEKNSFAQQLEIDKMAAQVKKLTRRVWELEQNANVDSNAGWDSDPAQELPGAPPGAMRRRASDSLKGTVWCLGCGKGDHPGWGCDGSRGTEKPRDDVVPEAETHWEQRHPTPEGI